MSKKEKTPRWGDIERMKQVTREWEQTENYQACLDLLRKLADE